METWKDIAGREGSYQVSDQGRVRSLARTINTLRGLWRVRERILKPGTCSCGRLSVKLGNKAASKRIHLLVAVAFLGPCPEGYQICHGPNGVRDNSISNLSYGTPSSNMYDKRRDGTHGGCTVIRGDGEVFINLHVAAEMSGCYPSNIWKVCNGHRITAGGFTWKYKEEPDE